MAGAGGGVVPDPAGCMLPAAAVAAQGGVAAQGVAAHGDAAAAEVAAVAVAAGGEEVAPGGEVAGASCPVAAAVACSTPETATTCHETEHNHARTQMTEQTYGIPAAMRKSQVSKHLPGIEPSEAGTCERRAYSDSVSFHLIPCSLLQLNLKSSIQPLLRAPLSHTFHRCPNESCVQCQHSHSCGCQHGFTPHATLHSFIPAWAPFCCTETPGSG